MTSTRRRPGIIYVHYDGNIDLDVYGGLFLAHSGANGQASTMLDRSGNNFLKIIDDVNGDFSGMLMNFSPTALEDDPELLVYYEWPHPCFGWKQKPLLAIQALFEKHGHEWLDCRIDGCRYGMVDAQQNFLRKKWLVKTNDELFHSQFRCKVCQGGHCHGRIEGRETQKSSYYPWKMVQSIARFWAKQTVSNQQLRRMNFQELVDDEDIDLFAAPADEEPGEIAAGAEPPAPNPADEPPNAAERERWKAKLMHFHKAAGHCSSRNLSRIVRDANLDKWKIKMAEDFTCPICEGLKPGGASSGNVPPAATHAQFGPWQALGLDASEWVVPGLNQKIKFLLMIDYATKLRVAITTDGALRHQSDAYRKLCPSD